MKVLAVGDVVGDSGCKVVEEKLLKIKEKCSIDLVIVNGENSAETNGICPNSMRRLFAAGADVITTGNHSFKKREIHSYYDSEDRLIRPLNYPTGKTPGKGYTQLELNGKKVIVVNLLGITYMENMLCPFLCMEKFLKDFKEEDAIIIVDFHAETTSEKKAMGYYLDGKVSVVYGTHTHVQTSDETVLEKGTAYITDLGMTGPKDSVLGVKKEIIISRLITKMPHRFVLSKNKSGFQGIIVEIDENTKKAKSIDRVLID